MVQPGRCGAARLAGHSAARAFGRQAGCCCTADAACHPNMCTAHNPKHTMLLGLELMVGYSGKGSMAVLVPLAHSRP